MLELLTANIAGKARREKLGGREHIVAPLTLIVPGVLAGNRGPILYTNEEIEKNFEAWNGMPIVLDHPYRNGRPVSARSPEVLNESQMGVVLKTKVGGKLTAEGWFDVENTRRIALEVFKSLEAGNPLELSTGLFMNAVEDEGEVDGKTYFYRGTEFRPDHLAILSKDVGACSVDDGCGVFANKETKFHLTNNGLSHEDIRGQLNSALVDRFGDNPIMFVSDVFDDEFVYHRDGELFRLSYSVTNNTVEISDEAPEEVRRVTSFESVSNSSDKEEEVMAKKKGLTANERKELVDDIIANSCDCFEESERDVLSNFSDDKLKKLQERNALVANAAQELPPKKEPAVPVVNESTQPDKSQTEEEWLASAPVGIRTVVQNAMNFESQQKAELIQVITANAKFQGFTKEMLSAKDLTELRMLAAAARPEESKSQPVANYLGAAAPTGVQQRDELDQEDILELPTMNLAGLASEHLTKRA